VGFAALLAFMGGVAAALRALWRRRPGLAAGPAAALLVFAAHAAIDWDWELPALSLVALALAGAAVAWLELEPRPAATARGRAGSARASEREPLASGPGRFAP
jgi:hypothetical protein